ncbi:hypothetical protein Kisp01_61080 [Kineosporia sp. NBRC 101677]|nr:hypothetical protein Kisp01_61080 [Kineosporia sp. NBRC 101677]
MNSSAANPATKAAAACPEALPTDKAVDGLKGTGYTVEKGNQADPFSATVLGRITDGIGPGIDMIMADVDSAALDRAGGVWSGMSGSPVYTADGKLIGAVSYTLTGGNTSIAGLTPAADMLALRNDPSNARGRAATTEANQKVAVSSDKAARIARTGEVSTALAAKGFRAVSTPLTATGLAKKNTAKFLKNIEASSGTTVRVGTGSGASATVKSSPSEIFAGSNYAAALSYGDVSFYGLGTTTYVCDKTAVAWGHPLLSAGPVSYSAHPAQALFVQRDPLFSPFKVGNPGGVVGTITWDGTVGLRSTLGQNPEHQIPVTTSLTNDHGKKSTGKTVAVYQPWAADIAATHLQAAVVKALGAQPAGSSEIKIVIKGSRADGKNFKITHKDYVADTYDISYATADRLYSLMWPLIEQEYEEIQVTGVEITGEVSTQVRQYSVSKVQLKDQNKWVALKDVEVAPGASIPLRATLKAYRSTDTITVPLTVSVPDESPSGSTGSLSIDAGGGLVWDEEEPEEEPADSFEELIKELNNQPSSNTLVSRVDIDPGDGSDVLSSTREADVEGAIASYYDSVSVTVK